MGFINLLQEENKMNKGFNGAQIHSANQQIISSACSYLFSFLRRFSVDLGPLLKSLSENMSDQRFTSDLHGNHVPSSFQHCLWSGELTANVIFSQLNRLCWELLCLVPLVTVSEIFPKLLWSQAKLFSQAIYKKGNKKKKESRNI